MPTLVEGERKLVCEPAAEVSEIASKEVSYVSFSVQKMQYMFKSIEMVRGASGGI